MPPSARRTHSFGVVRTSSSTHRSTGPCVVHTFGPGDDVVVAVPHGPGLDGRGVGPGVGLGDAERDVQIEPSATAGEDLGDSVRRCRTSRPGSCRRSTGASASSRSWRRR